MQTTLPCLRIAAAAAINLLACLSSHAAVSHVGFFGKNFVGPTACAKCHDDKIAEVMGSIHYTWRTPNPKLAYPGGGAHGMIDRFCALVGSSAMLNYYADLAGHQGSSACGKCHVGKEPPFPDPATGQPTQAQINGIDCLICHASDGNYDMNGDGVYELDENAVARKLVMDSTTGSRSWFQDRSLRAAESVGVPVSTAACLRCHEHGLSSPDYKRGTPYDAAHDVHAAKGLLCTDCHKVAHHQMARGSRVTDMHGWEMQDVEVDCAQCHASTPHPQTSFYNKHTSFIACETCHIPWTSGATRRVWASVVGLTNGSESAIPQFYSDRGVYEPYSAYSTPAYGVRPVHRWFNGNASMLAEPVHDPAAWDFKLAAKDTPGAKIYPFRPIISGMAVDRRGINMMPDFDSKFTMLAAMDAMQAPLKQMGFLRSNGLTAAERQVLAQFPNLLVFDEEHYVKTGNVKEAVDIGMGRMATLMQGGNAFGTPTDQLKALGAQLWSGQATGLDMPDNPNSPTYVADNDPTTVTGSYISLSHAVKSGKQALHCADCHSATSVLDFAALNYSPARADFLRRLLGSGTRILAWEPSAKGVRLYWNATPGRAYAVWTCSDLKTGNWTKANAGITATGETAEVELPVSSARPGFFRVELLP